MNRIAIFALLAVLGLAVCVITAIASQNLLATATDDPCQNSKNTTTYRVEIQNDKVSPKDTRAKLCDQLIITNRDHKSRRLAFGEHDQHIAYDGIKEKILSRGQNLTVTLNKPGAFMFHDHYEEEVQGFFTVMSRQGG